LDIFSIGISSTLIERLKALKAYIEEKKKKRE